LAPEPLPVTSLYAFRTPFVHAKRQVLPQHCQMLMFQKPCGQVGPKELDSSTETMPPAKPGAPVANVASRDLGSQQNRAIGSNDERNYREGQALVKRLEKKFGKPKALSDSRCQTRQRRLLHAQAKRALQSRTVLRQQLTKFCSLNAEIEPPNWINPRDQA
jgi:hypothetical protein